MFFKPLNARVTANGVSAATDVDNAQVVYCCMYIQFACNIIKWWLISNANKYNNDFT